MADIVESLKSKKADVLCSLCTAQKIFFPEKRNHCYVMLLTHHMNGTNMLWWTHTHFNDPFMEVTALGWSSTASLHQDQDFLSHILRDQNMKINLEQKLWFSFYTANSQQMVSFVTFWTILPTMKTIKTEEELLKDLATKQI